MKGAVKSGLQYVYAKSFGRFPIPYLDWGGDFNSIDDGPDQFYAR